MGMIIDRTKMISGPCKVTVGGTVLYSIGDVEVTPEIEWRDIDSSVNGVHDAISNNIVMRIKFKPKPLWSYRTVLLPSSIIAPSYSGGWLYPSTDQAVVVLSADGEQYTFPNARITKIPECDLGMGKDLWGDVEFTALHKQGGNVTDADSLYTWLSAQSWVQSDFPTGHDEVPCVGAWGAKTGWTAIQAQEGWKLRGELKLNPVAMEKQIVNYKIRDVQFLLSCIPVGVTTTLSLAELLLENTGGGPGRRLSATPGGAIDLVVAGTGVSVTLKNAALKSAGFKFGNEVLRHGEYGWLSCVSSGARLVLA